MTNNIAFGGVVKERGERMKLYAVAIMVMKPDPELQYSGEQSFNLQAVGEDGANLNLHVEVIPGAELALTQDDAREAAMHFALLRYPYSEGWVRHKVSVKGISRRDVLLAASAPEDESSADASDAVV